MKIALLPSAYAPAVGGVEELTARLAGRLVGGGDEVEVWTIRHPPTLLREEAIAGIPVRRFSLPLPRLGLRSLVSSPRYLRAASQPLLTAARAFQPDVVHVQCFSANGVYATWLAWRLKLPLVVSLQGETVMDDGDIYDRSVTLRQSLRTALRRADAVTGCSRFVLDDAERRFGLRSGRGVVLPNGVALDEPVAPNPLALPFERFVFAVGRVVTKKGFDLLLEAFARIAPDHPAYGLVIGGSGPALGELERRAEELGLAERVAFPGTLSRAEVTWAMAAADVFVLPSRVEPFGIVVLEALRAGCPVVVSRHGGAPEIVRDGIDGLVVDPLDTPVLASAIASLLDDRVLARRLGASGPGRAATYDWGVVAARYRDIYSRVAS
jgi:glycosyltransferase involved in cell wall biosynthesis